MRNTETIRIFMLDKVVSVCLLNELNLPEGGTTKINNNNYQRPTYI